MTAGGWHFEGRCRRLEGDRGLALRQNKKVAGPATLRHERWTLHQPSCGVCGGAGGAGREELQYFAPAEPSRAAGYCYMPKCADWPKIRGPALAVWRASVISAGAGAVKWAAASRRWELEGVPCRSPGRLVN